MNSFTALWWWKPVNTTHPHLCLLLLRRHSSPTLYYRLCCGLRRSSQLYHPRSPHPGPCQLRRHSPHSCRNTPHPCRPRLPAEETLRGKLVATLHTTLPLESGNNIHHGTCLSLNVLSVGNKVPQTILGKVLKDFANQTTNPESYNALHVVAQHHLLARGSSLASLPWPPYPSSSPPPPSPKPSPPPQSRSVWVYTSWCRSPPSPTSQIMMGRSPLHLAGLGLRKMRQLLWRGLIGNFAPQIGHYEWRS